MRAALLESARLDLLGPVDDHELIFETRVRDRYLVGMLAPDHVGASDPARRDDESPDTGKAADEAHDTASNQPPNPVTFFPSSLGLSFAVEPGVDAIDAVATWGHYRRINNPGVEVDVRRCWQRSPQRMATTIALRPGPLEPADFAAADGPSPGATVRISGTARVSPTGFWLVTLFLHNRQRSPKTNQDEAWLFQPVLEVSAPDGAAVFAGRGEAAPVIAGQGADRAERGPARHVVSAAGRVRPRPRRVGKRHRVARQPGRTDRITTTYLPTHELNQTAPANASQDSHLAGLVTDMNRLATCLP